MKRINEKISIILVLIMLIQLIPLNIVEASMTHVDDGSGTVRGEDVKIYVYKEAENTTDLVGGSIHTHTNSILERIEFPEMPEI